MASYHVEAKILRRAAAPEEYRVNRAAHEWDLTDPIVIKNREDLRSEGLWRDRMEPYHHQIENLLAFCRRLPVAMIADDVGLGKTISAGLIMSELISRGRLSKTLVICPKLLGPQWQEELRSKFGIPSRIALGKDLVRADLPGTGAVITTYQSARLHLFSIPPDRFEMLVLDEAHKLRNLYGTSSAPQVARVFRRALEQRRFRFVLMLTATPIQNRLWDLYSLVDLLTVARGHANPFGSPEAFARKFIADDRNQARRLRPEARDEFQSIVYGYMSRVRRAEARLHFPERVVFNHRVEPTEGELALISALAKPVQLLNRLAQTSILQALTSSPEALLAQLENMASHGTVPRRLAEEVRDIVVGLETTAKLEGLGALMDQLREEDPRNWRLVVFTGRLETQSAVQAFLERRGFRVGLINGQSGPQNAATLARFRQDPPDCHVIVSTEAGSEGINLQVANVVVNYDLPWNPMIVEQRIGRVQRLASEHEKVAIFNLILEGTFEENIVGRLMEKLQMASHAIGDIEALLEASGMGGEEGSRQASAFTERIRRLVLEALAGKDVETAARRAAESIAEARSTLEHERQTLDSTLGGAIRGADVGPSPPDLPGTPRSMKPEDFAMEAFRLMGARIEPVSPQRCVVEIGGGYEEITFTPEAAPDDSVTDSCGLGDGRDRAGGAGDFDPACQTYHRFVPPPPLRPTLYAPGTAPFHRLVGRITATGVYDVEDLDDGPAPPAEDLVRRWVAGFKGTFRLAKLADVERCLEGTALVRVRATVAHDSYERLVEVACAPADHHAAIGPGGLEPLSDLIEHPVALGLDLDRVAEAAGRDEGIAAFCRFYLDRREQEVRAAGDDERRRKKLEDEFTPALEMTVIGLEGRLHRRLVVEAQYHLDSRQRYRSLLTVTPHTGELEAPEMATCEQTGRSVPDTCLGRCEVSGRRVLQHFLTQSEITARFALPEHTLRCELSGMRVLEDEAERSAVTGRLIATSLLQTSAASGRKAEPEHFGSCEFTGDEVLKTELAVSEISGRRYRSDQRARSAVSGRTGHRSEFVTCEETGEELLPGETEPCAVTGKRVRRGLLETCSITGKRVLPSEVSTSAVSGKKALKSLFVTSSISGEPLLKEEAVRSAGGNYCTSDEAKTCLWSGRTCHPEDIRVCELTGVPMHFFYAEARGIPRLQPLVDLLRGDSRTADEPGLWVAIAAKVAGELGGADWRVEAAVLSPDGKHLAACCEARTLLNLKTRRAALVFSVEDKVVVGRIALGRPIPVDDSSEK